MLVSWASSGSGINAVVGLSPAAWFRFGVGITTVTGVSQWSDQSGNARHLLQVTGAAQPALQADGSILFDGVDDYLKCNAFALAQPLTIYFLGRQITWTASDYIYNGNALAVEPGLRQSSLTPNIDASAGVLGPQSVDLILNTYGVVSAVFNGASAVLQINNGTPVTGNCGANNLAGFTLGALATLASGFSNIQAKEVILYSGAHDADTRAQVIRYLMRVGGL